MSLPIQTYKETNMKIYENRYSLGLLGQYSQATDLYLKARSTKNMVIQPGPTTNGKERLTVNPCIYDNGIWNFDPGFIVSNFNDPSCDKWRLYWILFKSNRSSNIKNVSKFTIPVKKYKPLQYFKTKR